MRKKCIILLIADPFLNSIDQINQVKERIYNFLIIFSYGTVYAAKDKKTNKVVAIKKVKIHDINEGFPITCLREIKIL